MSAISSSKPRSENPESQPFFPNTPRIPSEIAIKILQNMNNQELFKLITVSQLWYTISKAIIDQRPRIGPVEKFSALLNSLIWDVYNEEKFLQLKSLYNLLPLDLKLKFLKLTSSDKNIILHFAAHQKDIEFIEKALQLLPKEERKNYILSENERNITPFHLATSNVTEKSSIGNVMLRSLRNDEIREIETNAKNFGWNLDDPNPGVYDYAPLIIACPLEHRLV